MKKDKILIIEDEELIRDELKTLLSNAGYAVDCVTDFSSTAEHIKTTSPDLILLVVTLPGQDGFKLCTSIRSFTTTPILFLTGRVSPMDELQALTLGGDDYITKPFHIPILLARINVILKRRKTADQSCIMEYKGIRLHTAAGTVACNNSTTELTKTELKIMYYLLAIPARSCPALN